VAGRCGRAARHRHVPQDVGQLERQAELDGVLLRHGIPVAEHLGCKEAHGTGYRNPVAKQYAIELGLAFQLTNILRDGGR